MLRGLTTVSYWTDDMAAAKRWYANLLGVEPYYEVPVPGRDQPGYVEFRIGDYQHELGLVDRHFAPAGMAEGPGGVVTYWHVDDVDAALARLAELGATPREKPLDRGKGFITATVIDPFGNVLGVMYNPHYLEILAAAKRA